MVLDIKPTRSELLKLKTQIKLAKSGHSLLKKKRDGLILEFFELLKNAKTASSDLIDSYKVAQEKLQLARVVHNDLKLASLALAIEGEHKVELETKNIMGVKVPKIESVLGELKKLSYLGSSPVIDKVIFVYQDVLKHVVKVAEVETAMKRLLQEIEKTKRRVNALEFSRIPAMEEGSKYITLRLEEIERENVFRLKRIKSKA